jgi:hypothetical protein
MPDPSMVLMHEILVSMRSEMRENFVDIKNRISSLEGSMGLVLHYAGDRASHDADIHRLLDQLRQRIVELEQKLEQAG